MSGSDYAYVGFVNSDRTEGRGWLKPVMVGFDFDALMSALTKEAGRTGSKAVLVVVNPEPGSTPDWSVDVAGTWRDELGDWHSGPLPAVLPERWSPEKVARLRELREKFPDTPVAHGERAPLWKTLPRPTITRHGGHPLFLLFEDATGKVGDYTHYRGELRALLSTLDLATAAAKQVRASSPSAGRLHVVQVSVDVDSGRPATFNLDDPGLGHQPRPKVGEPGWDREPTPGPLNRDARHVWSEPEADMHPQDPDMKELKALLAELADAGPELVPVGGRVSSSAAPTDFLIPSGATWQRDPDGGWVVVAHRGAR